MSDQHRKIELNDFLRDVIFMHAYYKKPIGNLMTCTHYCHGSCDLVFPPGQSRISAGALFQNYKRTIKKNSKRVEQKIHLIKQQFLDKTTLLSVFEANPYLGELIACIGADNMGRTPTSKKKATRPIYQDDDEYDSEAEDSVYNEDALPTDHLSRQMKALKVTGRSPIRSPGAQGRRALFAIAPQMDTCQLVESSESDANPMGLLVVVGNSKRVTDSARTYSNWLRITIPVKSPADYEKINLTLVPNQASLLQLEYPGVSEAIIKDYKLIETQMEVEIFDSNENNQGFVTNVQERIIVQETVLARGRAEQTTKSKLLILPIDPTTGRNFTCHNFHWQGSTHTDTSIGEIYLRAYKSVIPIKADEIQEGGGFDEDEKINPNSYQGSRYYKSYIVPISGQDGEKLAEKPVVKEAMKLKTKADRAMDMLNSMQGGAGV
jgi:hypothetical protein